MGAEPYDYFVPFEADVQTVLDKLRQREFHAGRFNGSHLRPATIEQAIAFADDSGDGTRSILDMERIGDEPDFGVLVAVPSERLVELYGTDRPSHEMIEQAPGFFEELERGHGVYVVVYRDGAPSEIYFGGYSYD